MAKDKEYTVRWEIEVTASSKKEAAEKALKIQRDSNSIATVFLVEEFDNTNDEFESIDID